MWISTIGEWYLEDFHEKNGIDLSFDRVAVQRIRDAAEATKLLYQHTIKRIFNWLRFTMKMATVEMFDLIITRAKLEELTRDLVERTVDT